MSRFWGALNIDPDPDVYLPKSRARREVPPLYMRPGERELWRQGMLVSEPRKDNCVQVSLPEPTPVQPVPKAATPHARRPHTASKYMVAWRNEWGDSGQSPLMGRQQADAFAHEYERPGCWAALIDRKTYRILREYGTRFADLVKQRNAASQDVSMRRKPVEREAVTEMDRRAAG